MTAKLAPFAALGICGLVAVGCSNDSPNAAELTGPSAVASLNDNSNSDDALQNLPTDTDGQIRRAQLLRAQGNYEDAAADLVRLMLASPDDPRVVGEYGKLLVQEGKSRDALAFLTRATQLQPNDWMLYSALGVAYDQLGDPGAAKTAYEHALSLKPGNASVLNNYAMSRVLAGDLPGAQKLLAQANAEGSSDPRIANNVALVAELEAGNASAPAPTAAANPVVGKAPAAYAAAARPQVVMEPIPSDTQAGPVHHANPAPRHLAGHAAPKPATEAAKPSAIPALRTAADDLRADASN